MTTSLCLQFPPTKPISFCTNPSISLRNPSYLKSTLPLLSNYGCFSSSSLRCRNDHEAEEGQEEEDENEWEKLMKHCDHIDQQAKLLPKMKAQYDHAMDIGDYENAVRLQVAITEATENDDVARAMSNFNKAVEEERYEDAAFLRDNTGAGLVGWWAGFSDGDPYGHIIHVTADHGRFIAKSYSPWQLATAKDGTPLFEIYASTCKEGKFKEQVIYLMHMFKEDSGYTYQARIMNLVVCLSHLEPDFSQDMWIETLWRYSRASGMNYTIEEFREIYIDYEKSMTKDGKARELAKLSEEEKEKAVINHVFILGNSFEKAPEKLNDFLRLPAKLDRKACFSFSLTVNINNEHAYGEYFPYRNLDLIIHDYVDCIGRGIFKEENELHDSLWPFVLSHARNEQPRLYGTTNFNRIEVPATSDPLNGLYIGSNGFLATEVVQLRRKFGHWHEDGGNDDVSELEKCDYVEVLKLTGDPNVPAGQVAFRAKVGKKYKLSPWPVLEKTHGAVHIIYFIVSLKFSVLWCLFYFILPLVFILCALENYYVCLLLIIF
ncbi:hypothetical protein DCAR_0934510 [Daucus carota subsp. sativus]|uniref:Uncharacterized protein n=1 Tax=Daucus carota subsp. sativus TaxID=79200 RepID=A0AAF0XVX6_DAUCS|nr:hypothetical protein DCAR_0934510 [Daucus carota subsp. sativus]